MELGDSGDVMIMLSATNDKKGQYDWEDIIQFSKNIELWLFVIFLFSHDPDFYSDQT